MKPNLVILIFLMVCFSLQAEVRLPGIFTGNMVIQRDKPVQIWGWADPGEKIKVSFNEQDVMTKAREDGTWIVQLKSMPANANSQSLMIESKENDIILKNVLVRDVMDMFRPVEYGMAPGQVEGW